MVLICICRWPLLGSTSMCASCHLGSPPGVMALNVFGLLSAWIVLFFSLVLNCENPLHILDVSPVGRVVLRYVLPVCSLYFHSFNRASCRERVFNLDQGQLRESPLFSLVSVLASVDCIFSLRLRFFSGSFDGEWLLIGTWALFCIMLRVSGYLRVSFNTVVAGQGRVEMPLVVPGCVGSPLIQGDAGGIGAPCHCWMGWGAQTPELASAVTWLGGAGWVVLPVGSGWSRMSFVRSPHSDYTGRFVQWEQLFPVPFYIMLLGLSTFLASLIWYPV